MICQNCLSYHSFTDYGIISVLYGCENNLNGNTTKYYVYGASGIDRI